MAVSAFSNAFISLPLSHPCHSYEPKFSSLRFPSSRYQPLATHLSKTTSTTRFTTFCSLDAANDPKEDTLIKLSARFCCPLMSFGFSSPSIFGFCRVAGYPAFPTSLDINKIRDILPHRVIEHNPGVSAVAINNK
ncbi:hypothetical protein CR513_18455, partial [Mucuna pruriens]